MIRSATPQEINAAFEAERARLGRPMTYPEIQALDTALAQLVERDAVAAMTTDSASALLGHSR